MTTKELIKKIPRSNGDEWVLMTVKLREVSDKTFNKSKDVLYEEGYDLLAIKDPCAKTISLIAAKRESSDELWSILKS